MASETFWLNQFEKTANLSLTWRLAADDLLIAADLLFDAYRQGLSKNALLGRPVPRESRLLPAILLLRAAALEALLKGRAARRGHRFVIGGRFNSIPNTGNGHDLVLLASATAFSLSTSERDLLLRLSPHLELSRYPIGKSWRTGLRKHSEDVGYVLGAYYSSGDERIMSRLVTRLRRSVH